MQKCSYCGCENEDAAPSCGECGSSLTEASAETRLPTPHRMLGEIQQSIWEHFAVKRRQFYLAGCLIGALGALVAAVHHAEHGFPVWSIPAGGALGVGAVWVLSFLERLQARILRARAEGTPTGAQQVLFVVVRLIALVMVALLVAGLCVYLL